MLPFLAMTDPSTNEPAAPVDLDALRRELERIGAVLAEKPKDAKDPRPRFQEEERELLELALRALAALLAHQAVDRGWLALLDRRVRRLGQRVGGGARPEKAAERPPRPEKPERKEERRPSGREGAIAKVVETYRPFLEAERKDAPPLPVLGAREDIVRRMREHQVLLLVSETGSGKTLLSPFYALEAGLGRRGGILQTQPRRVAARQIAARLAEMSGTAYGSFFGCHTRIDKDFGKETVVKVATDGIILQEMRGDPLLRRYDLMIVDEAHERSLNIDLLLGLLKRVRSERPDLRILVSSATLETERFRNYWGLSDEQVIEVPGRLYPVHVEHRDPEAEEGEEDDREEDAVTVRAAREVERIVRSGERGDVLVFMPRVKEIQDTVRAVQEMRLPNLVVMPMHGRQDPEENRKCLLPHPNRKVIVATNIAETSLTVEGVRFVIDSGFVNEKRYDPRTGITSLLPRPNSLASARQRAGRAGRLEEGWCVRLWPEAENGHRRADTEPEIARSDLTNLVLTMKMLGIDDVLAFPFLTRPDSKRFYDARQTLIDLGALTTGDHKITDLGRRMAELPLDARLARMVLAAEDRGCLNAVLSVAAALAIDSDPFRPPPVGGAPGLAESMQKEVDAAKRKLAGGGSDFDLLRNLVEGYRLRKWKDRRSYCEANRLRVRVMEEILSIRNDLVDGLRERGHLVPKGEVEEEVDRDEFHQAVVAGLVQNVAVKSAGYAYVYAANREVFIHPASVLFHGKERPQLLVAAAVVEGESRTFLRHVGPVSIRWLEDLAPHLIGFTHRQKRYDRETGRVIALENVYFRELTLAEDREIDYFGRDPAGAMALLVSEGLLADRFELGLEFHRKNEAVLEEVREFAERLGRRDLVPDESAIVDFYGKRLEGCRTRKDVVARVARKPERVLSMRLEDFLSPADLATARALFPTALELHGELCPVEYFHDPWNHRTRTTITLPLDVARRLTAAELDTLIPGLALKQLDAWAAAWNEAGLQPAVDPEAAGAIAATWKRESGFDLAACFARHVGRDVPEEVARAAAQKMVQTQATPMLRVLDEEGKDLCVASGHEALRRALERGRLQKAWEEARAAHETAPTPRYQEFPTLLAGAGTVVRVAEGVDAFVGLPHLAGGFARKLFKSLPEAADETRRALSEFLRLRLALRPQDRAGLEGEVVPAAIADRFFKRTGRPSIAEDVRALLWRLASGGFLSFEELGAKGVMDRLESCRREAIVFAKRLPEVLDSILGRLSTIRKRLDKGEVPLDDVPAAEDLYHRTLDRLRSITALSPDDLEAIDRELKERR